MSDLVLLATEEDIVERGLTTFVETGAALGRINRGRLYRVAGYSTFDDYCEERWGLSRVHAWRLIQASEVVRLLPMGNKPNERQARELLPALARGEETVREVWTEVIERSAGKPTARVVREVVAEIIEAEESEPTPEAPPQRRKRLTVTETRQHLRHIESALALLIPDELAPAARPLVLDAIPRLSAWMTQWAMDMSPEHSTETETP